MTKRIRELQHKLAENAEQRKALRDRRSDIEHQLQVIGEQYRMGSISLAEYDRLVSELLGGLKREALLAEIDHELNRYEREERHHSAELDHLLQQLPQRRTVMGMQIAIVLLAVIIMIGSLLMLKYPQGMIIYRPPVDQGELVEVPSEPVTVEQPWSITTSVESQPVP